MCGIYGITHKNVGLIEGLIEDCHYRGPDARDVYSDDKVTLGHNLLSITADASVATQPWKTPAGNILVYNGEIFNYAELIEKYTDFIPKTLCDTELLAWGLDTYGLNFIDKIDSMHAFAYYKPEEQSIYLSRDHAGIKPLCYAEIDKGLVFANEASALQKHVPGSNKINDIALSCWGWSGLNISEHTFFDGIKRVLPGHTLKYNLNTKSLSKVKHVCVAGGANKPYNKEEFIATFEKTIEEYLIGNQPTGIFLSGGLDSAMIAHEVNKISKANTFTTGVSAQPQWKSPAGGFQPMEDFNSDYNAANDLAQDEGYNHTNIYHTPTDYVDYLDSSIKAINEPGYAVSLPLYYQTNEALSNAGMKVTLAGDMGDELLCGYPKYYIDMSNPKFRNITDHRSLAEYWIKTRISAPPIYGQKMRLVREQPKKWPALFNVKYNQKEISEILSKTTFSSTLFNPEDLTGSMMRYDQVSLTTEDFFRRNDHLGMNFSMEGRFPFASKRMMTYCNNISIRDRLQPKNTYPSKPYPDNGKRIPQHAYKGKLPNYIINKEKTGWTSPIFMWLNNESFKGLSNEEFELITSALDESGKGYITPQATGPKSRIPNFIFNKWADMYNMSFK